MHPHQVLTRHLPRATHFPPPPGVARSGLAALTEGLSSSPTAPGGAPAHGESPPSLTCTFPGAPATERSGPSAPAHTQLRAPRGRTPRSARLAHAHGAGSAPASSRRFRLARAVSAFRPRPKQPPVSRAAPPRGRGHWCSPRAGGHRRDAPNLAFGKGTRARVPETAERRRTEPNRAGETRIRPEERRRPEAAPSAAGTSRARPKGLSRVGRWAGSSSIYGCGGGRCGRRRCSRRPPGPGQLAAV